jgi:hypothetical protein
VYGSVRTVVWQGSVGDRRPYADLVGQPEVDRERASGDVVLDLSLRADLLEADFRPTSSGVRVRTYLPACSSSVPNGKFEATYGPAPDYRLGSDRGRSNHGITLFSKRVMEEIPSPLSVST